MHIAYCIIASLHFALLPFAFRISHFAFCVLRVAFCILHFCILHFAFRILHFAFCIFHFSFFHFSFFIFHFSFFIFHCFFRFLYAPGRGLSCVCVVCVFVCGVWCVCCVCGSSRGLHSSYSFGFGPQCRMQGAGMQDRRIVIYDSRFAPRIIGLALEPPSRRRMEKCVLCVVCVCCVMCVVRVCVFV